MRSHPDVLEVRWQIYAKAGRWEPCIDIAESLVKLTPDRATGYVHRSFALHELKRTQEAFDLLHPVAEKFSKEAVIPYNLACYACQLGRLQDAREWFKKCLERAEHERPWKLRAMDDPDLEPLWKAQG